MNLTFDWNKAKAKDNYAKHGIRFELAKQVFKDPFAIEFLDDRQNYGEERFVILTEMCSAFPSISSPRSVCVL